MPTIKAWIFRLVIFFLSAEAIAQGTISRPIIEGYGVGPFIIAANPVVAATLSCGLSGWSYGDIYTNDTGLHPVYRYTCIDSSGERGNPTWRLVWMKRCSLGFGIWPPEAADVNKTGGECIGGNNSFTPQNYNNSCPGNITIGNPINIAMAEKIQTEKDIYFSNSRELFFERYYNSGVTSSQSEGSFGSRWLHNFDRRIVAGNFDTPPNGVLYWKLIDGHWVPVTNAVQESLPLSPNYAYVVRSNGKSIFHRFQNNQWQADYGVKSTLTRMPNNKGWLFTTKDSTRETYDIHGRLVAIETIRGEKISLYHELSLAQGGDDNPDTLDMVNDNNGNFIQFTYNTSNRLSRVTSSSNNMLTYNYDSQGKLSSVTHPDNSSRHYHYEDNNHPDKLTGITDEKGERYVSWQYDNKGRPITSEKKGAENIILDYVNIDHWSDPRIVVTNELKKRTTYHYQIQKGLRKLVKVEGHPSENCAGANHAYTYDSNGFMASKTDWQGSITTYVHNDRGQETSRTEASGTPQARTITTEWHSQFNLPVRITEPERETVMTYDDNGRLTSRQSLPRDAQ